MSYLLCIETATPIYKHHQDDVAKFYCNTLAEEEVDTKRKINIIAKKSGIRERYSVISDFSENADNFRFFPANKLLEPEPGIVERMALFKKEALPLAVNAVNKIKGFEDIKSQITHIITVTCTGLFAPGLDIELISTLSLKPSIQRSSVNFMGCNAAILAIKQADQICRSTPNALILIVCTELCTIHFQKNYTDDYILSNLLFADGSAAALVGENKQLHEHYKPLKIKSFQSLIIHEGYHDMAWQLSEKGFIMNLTSYVSGILNKNVKQLLDQQAINKNTIKHWAIHPGGKKILDDFCNLIALNNKQLYDSYKVLADFGNMSSVTILFVLQRLQQTMHNCEKETIYAAAFGPGLSIESAIFEYV